MLVKEALEEIEELKRKKNEELIEYEKKVRNNMLWDMIIIMI